MIFGTNKDKGNSGLGVAIGHFMTSGQTVSIPINDTQDYDLIVDDGKLNKVQVKATAHRTEYNVTKVDLRNTGGTSGRVYKRVCDTDIDYVFVVNELGEKWLLPKDILTSNSMQLGNKYSEYRVL